MDVIQVFATLVLGLTLVLCGGMIIRYVAQFSWRTLQVEDIRRLRQEGLAVNQAGEA